MVPVKSSWTSFLFFWCNWDLARDEKSGGSAGCRYLTCWTWTTMMVLLSVKQGARFTGCANCSQPALGMQVFSCRFAAAFFCGTIEAVRLRSCRAEAPRHVGSGTEDGRVFVVGTSQCWLRSSDVACRIQAVIRKILG
mmetsp:Transcript_76802/g.176209  ORF Transcript_76802/g.176209 Transcript_76802/m.176209 type:complete len:138 (+) Transcript_76802:849-1262(+)